MGGYQFAFLEFTYSANLPVKIEKRKIKTWYGMVRCITRFLLTVLDSAQKHGTVYIITCNIMEEKGGKY